MDIKVFTQFRAPVNSYPQGEMYMGLHKPGRYSGFDIITGTTLDIRLKHSDRIKKSSPSVGGVITEITLGAVLMPNGCIVHGENNGTELGIALTVDNNIGNSNTRNDLIVCEHEYVQIVGGQQPIFFIQKGANDGSQTTLANPEKQVILGKLSIEPGGSSFAHLTYTKSETPITGDENYSEFLAKLGITAALAGKASSTDLASLDSRVVTLENDTTVADLAQDIFNLETVDIPDLDTRVTDLETANDQTLKTKIVYLETWLKDRKYTLNHGITSYNSILSISIDMVCKAAEGGYITGDITQAQSGGLDQDGSADYDYGISSSWRSTGSTTVTVMTGDRIYLREGPWDVGTDNDTFNVDPTKWTIRLMIIYY